ncbi:MAG: hypothetical protein Q9227_009253 [Pyrenula ochraceoflavens]
MGACRSDQPVMHGVLGKASILVVLNTHSFTSAYTYWVDQSCSGTYFESAFNEALKWAERGRDRLLFGDSLQREYFHRLFASSDDPRFADHFDTVVESLGGLHMRPGIADVTPEPNNDRKQSNYRYYCDDDFRSLDPEVPSRWKLRSDPDPPFPALYTPQRNRPSLTDIQPGELWQEYEDKDNGM